MNAKNSLTNRLITASEKIEKMFWVRVIRDGLVTMIPLLMIGGFALVLMYLPIPAYLAFIEEFAGGLLFKSFNAAYMATFGVMSIYMTVAFSISYFSIKHPQEGISFWGALTSLCAFLILDGIASESFSVKNLGATSVSLAMISSMLASVLYDKLNGYFKNKTTTYSYGVDSRMNSAIAALVPTAIVITLASLFSFLVTLTGRPTVYRLFSDFFVLLFKHSAPIFGKGLEFILLSSVLWCFGIHGSDCLEAVTQELFMPLLENNIAAVEAGSAPVEILCKQFFDCFILMGGCGSAICLLIAILIACRNKGMRNIARTAAIPMLFNINELMVFGLPIVFNPIICIPFVLVPVAQYLVSYTAFATGLVPLITSSVEWTTPIILGGYAATGSVAGSILQIVNVLIGVAIYLPFVRMMERIHLDRENANIDNYMRWYKENESELSKIRLTECPGIYGEISKKLLLDLRTAIDQRRFIMYYQPQYNYNGECVGVEALLRWPLAHYSTIYPPILIQLAKEGNKLETLEEYIVERVIGEQDDIFKKFGEGIKVSINVTGISASMDKYWSFLRSTYSAHPFQSGSLCVEITEQETVDFNETITSHFEACKELGIEFAIDDFSMGQTSVNYLKDGLFDYLKLDGNLVRGLNDNPRCREIISSIITMSESLHLDVIAEYVETEELRAILHEIGCNIYQGYLFSPAVPLTEAAQIRKDDE